MKFEFFINFDGNCREAVEFYAKVFKTEVGNLMTYGDAPADDKFPLNEADRDRIMYAGIAAGGMTMMFMDAPTGHPVTVGDNINPTISSDDKDEVARLFEELKEGGMVLMELQATFFSDYYAMVCDKYGVIWHILFYAPE